MYAFLKLRPAIVISIFIAISARSNAADYILSDTSTTLPPGVTVVSPGVYSGGVLTLGAGDTISIEGTKPATLTFTGAFTTGVGNSINASGLTSDLNLVTIGALTVGADSIVKANATSIAAVNIGIGSTLSGNLTTASSTATPNVTGVVTLAANSSVGGYILTDAGAVTVGIAGSVGGAITTQAGVVTLGANVTTGGGISTGAGAVTVGDGSQTVGGGITTGAGVVTLGANVKIDGDITTIAGGITIGEGSATCGSVITTGAGVVALTTNVKIGGSISTVAGAITVGAGSKVGGDIIPSGAGVVTLTGVHVGGDVITGDGAITVTDSRVGGVVVALGAGVVTITSSVVNDTTLVVPPSPACQTVVKAPATVTLSDLTQTYTGSPLTPTATTAPVGLTVIWTNAPQTAAGTYPVTATINDPNYEGSASGTFTIAKATPTATLTVSNSPQTYNGSGQSATVAISASSVSGVVANILTGGAATQTPAGTYAVTADFVPTDSANYNTLTGLSAGNFVIAKATATVTLSDLTQTYTGSPLTPTATTAPVGLTVTWTNAPQTAVGSYPVTATINDPNYQGSASGTFEILTPYETWRRSTIGAGPIPASNNDLDRLTDLMEYAFGSDPASGVPVVLGNGGAVKAGNAGLNVATAGDGSYDVTYRRPLGGRADVSYTLEQSSDLAVWTTVSAALTTTSNMDGTETLKWTARGAAGSKGFVRMKLDLAAPAATQYTWVEGWMSTNVQGTYQSSSHNLVKKPVFSSTISSASGSSMVSYLPDTRDLRTYMDSTKPYYVEITSGANEGHRIDVSYSTTTATSIGLDLASVNNTTNSLPSELAGATFLLREHVMLADLAPKAVFTGSNSSGTADQVQTFIGGIFTTYYLLDAGPSFYYWSKPAGMVNCDSLVIPSGMGVLVKHTNSASSSMVNHIGEARMNQFRLNLPVDISLTAGGYPLDDTPNSRAHTLASGFVGATSAGLADQIQLWKGDSTPNTSGYTSYWLLNAGAPNQYWTLHSPIGNASSTPFMKAGRAQFIKRFNATAVNSLVIPRPWTP